MNKKYELTNESITIDNHILYRIRALRDFGNVKAGELGGYVESEYNLSHEGDCWVSGDGKVFGNGRVFGNAEVYGNARVAGHAWVYDNAKVCGDAWVFGNACACCNILIFGEIVLYRGIWNKTIRINHKKYILSTTLKKVLLR